jgi:hypothetical protein
MARSIRSIREGFFRSRESEVYRVCGKPHDPRFDNAADDWRFSGFIIFRKKIRA